ncbi:MAG: hypothetical protein JJ916_12425 [Phycisphaerales bacterium]|nr:hypothetical protein [Phycisphaerales bacterium]
MEHIVTESANRPAPEATALSGAEWQKRLEKIAADPRMSEENTTISSASVRKLAVPFLFAGLVGLIVTIIGGFTVSPEHALASFEVGLFTSLAIALGGMFWVMVFHSLNAGWSITLRRQFENLGAVIWFPAVILILIAILEVIYSQSHHEGILLKWLNHQEYNHLLHVKEPYLNAGFLIFRVLIYAAAWIIISRCFLGWSRRMDETGDRRLGRKSRRVAGFAIPVFALTTTFAAFDYLMSPDYRFFSTMWGVYYFASCGLAGVSAVAIIAYFLRRAGKLEGLVTSEHYHDLGKLVFAFTVFWAYISFSQYFLIWYSNIPEETAWFYNRQEHGYQWLFILMIWGHFLVPFLLLIWRRTKRTMGLLAIMGSFMILMVIMDMVWILRPMVDFANPSEGGSAIANIWLDIAGVVGALGLFAGLVALKIAKGPLLPLKDPMLHEALKHKNYV